MLKVHFNPQRLLELPEEIKLLITERNSVDQAIYSAAKQLFNERISFLPILPNIIYEEAKLTKYTPKTAKYIPIVPVKTLPSEERNSTVAKSILDLLHDYANHNKKHGFHKIEKKIST